MVSVDITKCILAFLVVLLHTHGLVLGYIQPLSVFNQVIGSLCVPLFLVFSGYFFNRSIQKRSIKSCLVDNTLRLLALSLIYQSIWVLFLNDNGNFITQFISSDAKIYLITKWIYQLLFEGQYQFWYITSLITSLWMVGLAKKYHKDKLLIGSSIAIFTCLIATSTWMFPNIYLVLQPILTTFSSIYSNVYQSFLITLIFVIIGVYFDSIIKYLDKQRWMYFLFIGLFILEIMLHKNINMSTVSLWATSPLVCISCFRFLMRYPTHINKEKGLWMRHFSTVVYCIHFQLAYFMMSFVMEDVASINRTLYFGLYCVVLIILSAICVFLFSHLAKKHKIFSYFY